MGDSLQLGIKMMNQQRVRQTLDGGMTVVAWSPLARRYELIEILGALNHENYKLSTPEGDEPNWRRNVRNIFQKDKETPRLEWNPESTESHLNNFVVRLAYPGGVVTNKTQGCLPNSNDGTNVICFRLSIRSQ